MTGAVEAGSAPHNEDVPRLTGTARRCEARAMGSVDGKNMDAVLDILRTGRPLVMGILNVTPDSFSDGGRFRDPAKATAQGLAMAAEGADILDIGGESTRPGHAPVAEAEERDRVLPVIAALAEQIGTRATLLSVDTTKAAVARDAVAAGAAIVNDQWGFLGDPAMADVVAETGAAAVLMHNRAQADPKSDIAADMLRFFETSLAVAVRAGVGSDRLVLDPGIGFGKTPPQQLAALRAIPALRRAFGLPVLVGVSRKSFLGRLTGASVGDRLSETLAANLFAYGRGARLFRVHDVAPHVAALTVAAALEQAAP